MIRTLYRHPSGTIVLNLPDAQLLAAAKEPRARLWIDVVSPTPEEAKLVFEEAYKFHPLAIEDTLSDIHNPKLDNYIQYLFLVFHAIGIGDERMDIHTRELDVFLGHNFLITVRTEAMEVVEQLWTEEYHRTAGLALGPVPLLYELLNRQIDRYGPLIDRFEERVEELGDAIFRERYDDRVVLNDLLTAKSSALRLRRILMPQSDIVAQLAHSELPVIPSETRIYFQDISDHLVRLTELSSSMRDLVTSTIETHLALVNNRMNEVMKVLTMISTVFIPLSFLTGVYGMNFDSMPERTVWWFYPFLWIIFIAIAGGMIYLFRRLRWL